MANEDERQAALIKTNISTYVGTATLAVIAGSVALFTYIQQNFSLSAFFYVFMAISVFASILSFIMGGRGANETAKTLAAGTWNKDTKTAAFNRQAILTLIGIIFLTIATVIGTTSPVRSMAKDPCIGLLSHELAKQHPDLGRLRIDLGTC